MAGFKIQEMKADKPVAGVSTGISAALVHTDRGIPNVPMLTTGFGQWVNEFGYYIDDSTANYQVRAAYNNGARSIWGVRLVGEDAKCAMGADNYKFGPNKAQLTHGAAAAQLNLLADTRGLAGTLVNITITTSATTDKTTVSLANTYDISLVLAQTSAWKKCAKVCSYVLNGYAHRITGTTADDGICFYANTPGSGGDSYEVEIVDSGMGGATYAFSSDGYTLTIDLGGAAVTATTATNAVNALAKGIRAFVTGTGASNIAVTALANLTGGQSDVAALITASFGSTGLDAVTNKTRTFLAGQGAIVAAGHTFADTNTLDALALVTEKAVPGDILVIYNGADAGAYEIVTVDSQTGMTVDNDATSGWSASNSSLIYAIYGTNNEYGHVAFETLSPGERGDSMYIEVDKETGGATLKAVVKVLDGDGATRTLETFTGLSPAKDDSDFIDTRIATESRWVRTHTAPEHIIFSASDGATTLSTNVLTSASATFVDDEVEVGDLLVVTNSTTASDIHVYEITEVTDNTHLKVDPNFNGTAVTVSFTVLGEDHDGQELLALVGTSGLTLTAAGGVDDVPTKDEYQGDSSANTGVYALNKIPVVSWPNKFWCPDAPTVVDDSGVDATATVDSSMISFADSSILTAKGLVYIYSAEFGQTPTNMITTVSSDNVDSARAVLYWPWVRISDPVTGSYKWLPVTGHMVGVFDSMDAGPEGMHMAPANVVLRDVASPPNTSVLEYEVNDTEYELLVEANINPIIRLSGYRPYGARARTTDTAWLHIHKTLVSDRTVRSIVQSLRTWVPYNVQSITTWGKIRKAIEGYMSKYDRRIKPNGAFENYKDPTEKPWYILCDETNNDLAEATTNIELGFCVVNTIEEVVFRFGLWDGGVSVEEA